MEQIELNAFVRDVKGKKVKRLRAQGFIPSILYGKHLEEPICLMIPEKDLLKVLTSTEGGRGILFTLNIQNGESRKEYAILQDIQFHPTKLNVLHVDWHGISLEEEIEATVPIVLKGEAVGTKVGGILEIVLEEIDVRCLPINLPPHIEVDISNLNIGDSIHVRDLMVPEGVTVVTPPEEVIVTVVAPEAEEAPAEEAQAQEETQE
ncbi:50S ribosomal protein L25/general stress protein Ctc [bacterium]|nr:50S ribosomal protein L25/general stress protein Ctc [bacterium]